MRIGIIHDICRVQKPGKKFSPKTVFLDTLGLTRQSVQRTVDLLAQEGLIAFADNPHHQRAKLVDFTPQGRRIMEEVNHIQTTWANDLAQGLSAHVLHDALQLLEALRRRLDAPA